MSEAKVEKKNYLENVPMELIKQQQQQQFNRVLYCVLGHTTLGINNKYSYTRRANEIKWEINKRDNKKKDLYYFFKEIKIYIIKSQGF